MLVNLLFGYKIEGTTHGTQIFFLESSIARVIQQWTFTLHFLLRLLHFRVITFDLLSSVIISSCIFQSFASGRGEIWILWKNCPIIETPRSGIKFLAKRELGAVCSFQSRTTFENSGDAVFLRKLYIGREFNWLINFTCTCTPISIIFTLELPTINAWNFPSETLK